jgi:hypothetical protein
MTAWIDRRLSLAVRMVIRAVRRANDAQVSMWECILLTSGAVPATAIGPLRWIHLPDGNRLLGSYLPTWDESATGS